LGIGNAWLWLVDKEFRIDVNGLCRFSYPFALGAFDGNHRSMEDLRASLYGEARLRERIFIFSNVFLPALRQQTDPDFAVSVLVGDQMLTAYLNQLRGLVDDVPGVHLVIEPEGQDPKELCTRIFRRMRRPDADLVGEFRLDDDDAVAIDFVARSRQAGRDFKGPIIERGVAGVDFPAGAFVYFMDDDIVIRRLVKAHLSCAQIIFLRPRSSKSAIKFHHYRMWQKNLYISLPQEVMYLRSVHSHNVSGVDQIVKTKEVFRTTEAQIDRMVKDRFGIDLPRLRDDWRRSRP
jgi:hypothetical protein